VFPWIHPTFVHFAVALMFAAVLLDVAGLARRSEKLLFAGYWNTILGAVATLVAVATGFLAQARLGPRGEAELALLGLHRIFAVPVAVAAVLQALARILMRGYIRPRTRTVYLGFAFLCAGFTLVTGALGGAMVYGYGMGIGEAAARHVLDARPGAAPPAAKPLLAPAPEEPPVPPPGAPQTAPGRAAAPAHDEPPPRRDTPRKKVGKPADAAADAPRRRAPRARRQADAPAPQASGEPER